MTAEQYAENICNKYKEIIFVKTQSLSQVNTLAKELAIQDCQSTIEEFRLIFHKARKHVYILERIKFFEQVIEQLNK